MTIFEYNDLTTVQIDKKKTRSQDKYHCFERVHTFYLVRHDIVVQFYCYTKENEGYNGEHHNNILIKIF